jgi:hypothetical protein
LAIIRDDANDLCLVKIFGKNILPFTRALRVASCRESLRNQRSNVCLFPLQR